MNAWTYQSRQLLPCQCVFHPNQICFVPWPSDFLTGSRTNLTSEPKVVLLPFLRLFTDRCVLANHACSMFLWIMDNMYCHWGCSIFQCISQNGSPERPFSSLSKATTQSHRFLLATSSKGFNIRKSTIDPRIQGITHQKLQMSIYSCT